MKAHERQLAFFRSLDRASAMPGDHPDSPDSNSPDGHDNWGDPEPSEGGYDDGPGQDQGNLPDPNSPDDQ